MGYFADKEIELQEKAAAEKAFVVMDHQDMRRIKDRTDEWIAAGMKGALYKLFAAGADVAEEAYCLNTKLHGTMHARPSVFIQDPETIVVTYKTARPRTVAILAKNLRLAKKLRWPKALKET